MDINGNFVRTSLTDGSVSAPSEYFKGDPSTGIYREVTNPSTTAFAISKRGTKRLRVTDTGVDVTGALTATSFSSTGIMSIPDGSVLAPSLNFLNDTKTGLFRDTFGGSSIGIVTNQGERMEIEDTSVNFYVPIISGTNNISAGLVSGSSISTLGSLSCGTLTSSGTVSLGGSLVSCPSMTGIGSIGCGPITSSGTISCGTNSLTCGSLSSASTLPLSIASSRVVDFTSIGPVTLSQNQTFTTASTASAGSSTYALTFSGNSAPSISTNLVTYTRDTVNGDRWTINQTGMYIFRFGTSAVGVSGSGYKGVSRNAAATVAMTSWTQAQQVGYSFLDSPSDVSRTDTWTCFMNATDVVRCCVYGSGGLTSVAAGTWFEISFIQGTAASL